MTPVESSATNKFGSTAIRVDSVLSTNDVAKDLAASGASEGVYVIAREQTAGRGRQGRVWFSAPGEGLYLSVILRPRVAASESAIITLAAAVSVAETLRLDFHADGDIKWPNDVIVRGRKICGILVESAIEGNRLQYAVLGVGVNIAQRSFPDSVSGSATSLFLETGSEIQPEDFANALFPRLEHWYEASMSDPGRVILRWEDLSSSARDCKVRVDLSDQVVEGTTRGLTSTGALIVELSSGERREIVAGDVSVRSIVT